MMMVDSGMVCSRVSSCSTGNLPTGHSSNSSARSASLPARSICGVNGVSFSYSAINAFQQNDDSGWKYSFSDKESPWFAGATARAFYPIGIATGCSKNKATGPFAAQSPTTRYKTGPAINGTDAMSDRPQNVALVTGAARGIGLAVAKRFLAEGWRVALLDIEGGLLKDAVAVLADPDNTLALHCDVSDAAAVTAAFDALNRRFGRLDALVNNAGVAVFAPLLETSDQDWNRVLAVNLTGPFLCTKAAAPLMREHGGGAIVNITSISAVRASTLRSAYGTSKAGLAHLTKQLAVELASLGIRVNGVAPGPVETAMAKAVHTPEIRADYHDAIPLNRYGLEEELAEAVFFLCSDRASYITGQILAVDGGFDAAGIGLPTLRGQRRNG